MSEGAGLVAIGAIVYVAFGRALWLPGLPAALAWAGSAALTNQLLHAASNRARAQLRQSFERYLPPAVIDRMVRANALPSLGARDAKSRSCSPTWRSSRARTEARSTTMTDVEFTPLGDATTGAAHVADADLSRLTDVTVELTVEVGRTRMSLGETMSLGQGSVTIAYRPIPF